MDEVKKINSKQTGRNGEIDFLRFLFAVIIMLHHSRYVLGDENCVFLGGSLAVEFFFLVSGYLMMATVSRRNLTTHSTEQIGTETAQFLLRKVKAFLPEWIIGWSIGFVFVLIVQRAHSLKAIMQRCMDYFFEVTLLRSTGLHIDAINGVMWYLSAMLICMAISYPLLRQCTDVMTRVVCPVSSLLLLGWLMRTDGMLRNPHKWLGWTYKGNVRAMAEIMLGVVAFLLVSALKDRKMTRMGRIVVSLLEICLYALTIRYMYLRMPSEYDFFYLVVLFTAVILTFSGQGILYPLFQHPVSAWLAKYSTALFFAHLYIAQHMNQVIPEEFTNLERLTIYVILSLANGLLVMALADCWKKYGHNVTKSINNLLFENELT